MGSAELHRNLLASAPCGVTGHVPLRDGHRMLRQLGQESYLSLRPDGPTVSHRGHRLLAVRRAMAPRQYQFGLDHRPDRDRERLPPRMALREAPRVGFLSAFCLLPSAFCLLPSAFCLLPSAFFLLPSAFCLLPSAFCLLPSAFCLLPSGGWRTLNSEIFCAPNLIYSIDIVCRREQDTP